MTCKDCLHYEVCSQFSKADGANHEYYTYTNLSEKCECFKDKTEWVRLPCKVGDTVYCFAPCFDEERQPKMQVTETNVINMKTIATVPGMEFDVGKIGKTVFLTREEAEKELEKRRKREE